MAAKHDPGLGKSSLDQLRIGGDFCKTLRKDMAIRSPCLRRRLLGRGGNDHVVEAKVGTEDLEPARHGPTMACCHPGANWSAAGG